MTDRELHHVTQSGSVQALNQICRRLAERGLLVRAAGDEGLIVNTLHPDWEQVEPPAAGSSE